MNSFLEEVRPIGAESFDPPEADRGGAAAPARAAAAAPQPVRRLTTQQLFGEASEIEIEHASGCYRVRITASGKLIMTK